MSDPIEAVETFVEDLRGGTDVNEKALEKSKRPFEKKIRIANRGIKREERRNERLDLNIVALEEEGKTETAIYDAKMKAIADKIQDREEDKAENLKEIENYQSDIKDNQAEIAAIDIRIAALPASEETAQDGE